MSDVLDSSALLAFLFREPGGTAVEARLQGGMISAVNAAEVIAKLVDRGYRDEAALAVWTELAMDVIDYDLEQAKQSGLLRRSTMSMGLSLADRACLTLAARLGATAVTADRAWVRQDLGIAVELVR